MITDSTTLTKKKIQEINALVGPAFSIWDSLKLKGVGSPKLHIQSFSQGFKTFIEQNNSLSYCNIELRPKGIIIHQNKRATRLSWVIPFYRLSIFHSDVLSFHCNGEYLKIKKDFHLDKSRAYINKIIRHKAFYSAGDTY